MATPATQMTTAATLTRDYTYYPGCSLHSTASEFDESFRAVAAALGLSLHELDDWSCCGATSAHATSNFLATALPLRNLSLAERAGRDLIVPCAACYSAFRQAHHEVATDQAEGRRINDEVQAATGRRYEGKLRVLHPLEPLSAPEGLKAVAAGVAGKKPLTGLKVATYYGCLLQRPPGAVAFEDPEQPKSMDRIMEAAGATVVRWSYKTECCGASLTLTRPEYVVQLTGTITGAARRAGAQAIVTACPMCQANLDTRQPQGIGAAATAAGNGGVTGVTGAAGGGSAEAPVPIFYFTELLGLALGTRGVRSWLKRHITDPVPVLAAHGLL